MSRKRNSVSKRNTQAPGQFYGYSIQVTRMLARLLQCHDGQAISLEVLDDVAVHSVDEILVEQTKSGLAHNPISDRSVDLWKTLFNWIDAIRSGALDEDTKFILYVAQPHEGTIVKRLHEINQRTEARTLIRNLREEMWGKAPRYAKKDQIPESLLTFVNGFLEASDETITHLILGFELQTGSGSPIDDLRPALREKAISENAIDDVLKYLLGWIKQMVDKLIETRHPVVITWDKFQKQLIAAAKRFDRSTCLAPTTIKVSSNDVQRELRNRVYVRQLQIVGAANEELLQAVTDHLRASADRTTWSERGDVLEPSFEEFADKLQRHWTNRRTLAQVELQGRTELDLGRVVLAKCMELEITLQGMEIPGYFTPGSYHALADGLSVGWHPRYDELLNTMTFSSELKSEDSANSVDP